MKNMMRKDSYRNGKVLRSVSLVLLAAMCLMTFSACSHQHVMGDWVVDKEATCVEEGSKHIECAECGEIMLTDTIAAKGHTQSDWIVDVVATEKTEGFKYRECTVCSQRLDSQTIPKKELMSSEEIAAYVQERTVSIEINDGEGTGTGFFIDDQGTLVTCFHVIKRASWEKNGSIKIMLPNGGGTYEMDHIVKFDPAYDLAVLKIDVGTKKVPYLNLASEEAVAGTKVYTCGSSLGITTGNFSAGQISTSSHTYGLTDSYLADADIYSGNSGGPLVNAYGEVVGVAAASYVSEDNDTLNIFIKIGNLENLRIVGDKNFSAFRQWYLHEIQDAMLLNLYSSSSEKYVGNGYYSFIHTYHGEVGARCLYSSNTYKGYRGTENGYNLDSYYHTYVYNKDQRDAYIKYLESEGYQYRENLGGDLGGGTFRDVYYCDIDKSYIDITTYTWNGQRLLQIDMYMFV